MSNNPGFGVMLGMLGGNEESVTLLRSSLGKVIVALSLADDALHIAFEDGTKIRLVDKGQSCCESRYMRTDDNLAYHLGAKLVNVELRDATPPPASENDYGDHEIQFLDVTTDRGVFQMASHNEHNGYYGGFWIVCEPD